MLGSSDQAVSYDANPVTASGIQTVGFHPPMATTSPPLTNLSASFTQNPQYEQMAIAQGGYGEVPIDANTGQQLHYWDANVQLPASWYNSLGEQQQVGPFNMETYILPPAPYQYETPVVTSAVGW